MFEIIKNVIQSRAYELRDMLYKINKMYIESTITEEEKTQLDEMARNNANAENSYAPLQQQIDKAYEEINTLKETVKTNTAEINVLKDAIEKLGGTVEPPVEEPIEEWPEFIKPTGSHNCYNIGNKITFEGEKYICDMNGCVWSPAEYPQAWIKQSE